MKNQADARRTFRELKVGELVMVNSRYLTMRKPATSKKFCPLFVGPYRVLERVGASAYRVDLPVSCKAHNVLHVSKLWKYYPADRTAKVPEPVYIEDLEAFEVQRILNKRVTKKTVHYLVQWKNQDCSHNTWEPVGNLGMCSELVKEYERRKPNGGHNAASCYMLVTSTVRLPDPRGRAEDGFPRQACVVLASEASTSGRESRMTSSAELKATLYVMSA